MSKVTDDEKRVEEIRKRCDGASKGPWWRGPDGYILSRPEGRLTNLPIAEYLSGNPGDHIFISAARQDIPFLLSLLDAEKKAHAQARREFSSAFKDLRRTLYGLSLDARQAELVQKAYSRITDLEGGGE